jgi:hypothetical protein
MMKTKMKKFDEGGETEFASQFKPGRTDEGATVVKKSGGSSFNEAFRAARKDGLKTFKWRGGTYGTELASESKKPSKAAPAAAPKAEAPKAEAPKADAPKAEAPARRGYTRTARPESERTADYAANRRASFAKRANPFSGLGDLFGLREQERVMRDMGVDRAEAGKRLSNLKEMEEGEGMRRGGKVKRYASGGSVSSASKRADGCATKGKTRGKFV